MTCLRAFSRMHSEVLKPDFPELSRSSLHACRSSGILSSAQSSGFVAACRQHRSGGSRSTDIRCRVECFSIPKMLLSCPTTPLQFGQADAAALRDRCCVGPGSGIYKSTDAGETWKRLTNGLPTGDQVGRMGIAIAPSNPNVLYIICDHRGIGGEVYLKGPGMIFKGNPKKYRTEIQIFYTDCEQSNGEQSCEDHSQTDHTTND